MWDFWRPSRAFLKLGVKPRTIAFNTKIWSSSWRLMQGVPPWQNGQLHFRHIFVLWYHPIESIPLNHHSYFPSHISHRIFPIWLFVGFPEKKNIFVPVISHRIFPTYSRQGESLDQDKDKTDSTTTNKPDPQDTPAGRRISTPNFTRLVPDILRLPTWKTTWLTPRPSTAFQISINSAETGGEEGKPKTAPYQPSLQAVAGFGPRPHVSKSLICVKVFGIQLSMAVTGTWLFLKSMFISNILELCWCCEILTNILLLWNAESC